MENKKGHISNCCRLLHLGGKLIVAQSSCQFKLFSTSWNLWEYCAAIQWMTNICVKLKVSVLFYIAPKDDVDIFLVCLIRCDVIVEMVTICCHLVVAMTYSFKIRMPYHSQLPSNPPSRMSWKKQNPHSSYMLPNNRKEIKIKKTPLRKLFK